MLVRDCNLFVFFFFFFKPTNNLHLQWLWLVPVIVRYWSLWVWAGLEPKGDYCSSPEPSQVGGREVSDLCSSPSSSYLLRLSRSGGDPLPASWALPAVGHPALVEDKGWTGGHHPRLGAGAWKLGSLWPQGPLRALPAERGRCFALSVSAVPVLEVERWVPQRVPARAPCLPRLLRSHAGCTFSDSGGSSLP